MRSASGEQAAAAHCGCRLVKRTACRQVDICTYIRTGVGPLMLATNVLPSCKQNQQVRLLRARAKPSPRCSLFPQGGLGRAAAACLFPSCVLYTTTLVAPAAGVSQW